MAKSCFLSASIFFLLHCLTICSLILSKILNITTDQLALIALKSHIRSEPFNILSKNWSISSDVCNWIGVSCGPLHHRVMKLNISNMGLNGTIPPALGNLSFLVSLDVKGNNFHGILPMELAQLRRLRVLDFTSNGFADRIPDWLGFLPQLTVLSLRDNGFSGFIPGSLFNLSKLEILDLSYNSLHGKIGEEIGNLQSLKFLSIQYNQLTGSIQFEIFNVTTLETLALTENGMSGDLPDDICRLVPRLKGIYLSWNRFSGQIPVSLQECWQLKIVSLSNNEFVGPIPKEIGNISMLEMLYLGANNLTGEIPKEIGNLVNLKQLGMGRNLYSGSIPVAIFNISSLLLIDIARSGISGTLPSDICSNLPNLEELNLYYNSLYGPIPSRLFECSRLEALSLRDNQFSGPIPREIGNLTLLKRLHLFHNRLTGVIPQELGRLKKLEELHLAVNLLTGPIPEEIVNISTLMLLALTANRLSGSLPRSIGHNLPNLKTISLETNILSGVVPESISNSSKLTFLDFGNNNFYGTVPSAFGNLIFIEHLLLHGNGLKELSFIRSLARCRFLKELWVHNNPLNDVLPPSIGNLSTSFQIFLAYNSTIKGSIPPEISNLSNLVQLDLSDNNLNGLLPSSLDSLKMLQGLLLSNNSISGSIPIGICNLQNLGVLHLSKNQILGSIPECIGSVTSLRKLYLDSNRLDSIVPTSFWSLKNLLELNLSSNSLNGSLSPEVGNLKAASLIDLSFNQFSDDFPSTLGVLQNLIKFSLAHNRFRGSIPESMGNMLSLEALDLAYNNLSGSIPKSFEALKYLESFNVSHNKLSGEIPSSGPFKNFTSQSFMFNEALCGDPIFEVPPCPTTSLQRSNTKKIVLAVSIPLSILAIIIVLSLAFMVKKYQKKAMVPDKADSFTGARPGRISYYELLRATNGYKENNLLGRGSYGSVYKGILNDGTILAVKVFNLEQEGAFKSFDAECEVLRDLRHRNLTKVISSCSNDDFKALVLEYMPNGSLEAWLHSDDHFLDMMQRLSIMIDVACALEYLHHGQSTAVVHCDLKPSNVLLDEDMVAHVTDFGIAKLLGEGQSISHTNTLATFGYIAPEYGLEGLVSTKCDIYSYGILLMETFSRRKPNDEMFDGNLSLKSWISNAIPDGIMGVVDVNLFRLEDEFLNEKKDCVSSIMGLALSCSADNPEDRIGMTDVAAALKKIKLQFLAYCT